MSLAVARSRALDGLSAPEVAVEVHLAKGLPSFTPVGLPEAEVRESRERVRAALTTCGFELPARRITRAHVAETIRYRRQIAGWQP